MTLLPDMAMILISQDKCFGLLDTAKKKYLPP